MFGGDPESNDFSHGPHGGHGFDQGQAFTVKMGDFGGFDGFGFDYDEFMNNFNFNMFDDDDFGGFGGFHQNAWTDDFGNHHHHQTFQHGDGNFHHTHHSHHSHHGHHQHSHQHHHQVSFFINFVFYFFLFQNVSRLRRWVPSSASRMSVNDASGEKIRICSIL